MLTEREAMSTEREVSDQGLEIKEDEDATEAGATGAGEQTGTSELGSVLVDGVCEKDGNVSEAATAFKITERKGVAYRKTQKLDDRIRDVLGPEFGEVISATEVKDRWIKTSAGYWLPIYEADGEDESGSIRWRMLMEPTDEPPTPERWSGLKTAAVATGAVVGGGVAVLAAPIAAHAAAAAFVIHGGIWLSSAIAGAIGGKKLAEVKNVPHVSIAEKLEMLAIEKRKGMSDKAYKKAKAATLTDARRHVYGNKTVKVLDDGVWKTATFVKADGDNNEFGHVKIDGKVKKLPATQIRRLESDLPAQMVARKLSTLKAAAPDTPALPRLPTLSEVMAWDSNDEGEECWMARDVSDFNKGEKVTIKTFDAGDGTCEVVNAEHPDGRWVSSTALRRFPTGAVITWSHTMENDWVDAERIPETPSLRLGDSSHQA